MFDLNTLKIKDTFELHLTNPVSGALLYADEAETKPVKIVLYSTSSKQYRTATNAMQNRRLKRKDKQVTAEVLREEGIELLVACSDTSINMAVDGQPVDNPDAFRALYSDAAYDWVKTQVDAALVDTSLFI